MRIRELEDRLLEIARVRRFPERIDPAQLEVNAWDLIVIAFSEFFGASKKKLPRRTSICNEINGLMLARSSGVYQRYDLKSSQSTLPFAAE